MEKEKTSIGSFEILPLPVKQPSREISFTIIETTEKIDKNSLESIFDEMIENSLILIHNSRDKLNILSDIISSSGLFLTDSDTKIDSDEYDKLRFQDKEEDEQKKYVLDYYLEKLNNPNLKILAERWCIKYEENDKVNENVVKRKSQIEKEKILINKVIKLYSIMLPLYNFKSYKNYKITTKFYNNKNNYLEFDRDPVKIKFTKNNIFKFKINIKYINKKDIKELLNISESGSFRTFDVNDCFVIYPSHFQLSAKGTETTKVGYKKRKSNSINILNNFEKKNNKEKNNINENEKIKTIFKEFELLKNTIINAGTNLNIKITEIEKQIQNSL